MSETLADLRTRAQRRADQEGSSFVGSDEWVSYINEGIAELYEILADKNDDFFVNSTSITLVSGTNTYALPDGFLRVLGVDYVSGNESYTLEPFMWRERNRAEFSGGDTWYGPSYMYQVIGNNLKIVPDPSGSGTLTLWYVPQAPKLKNDTDSLPVGFASGWERYVVLYAAIKALQKEESDVSSHFAELQMLQKRIEANAQRTGADPKRIVDVRYGRDIFRS